jgi:hypothetical protein
MQRLHHPDMRHHRIIERALACAGRGAWRMHRNRISAPDLVKNWNWRRFDEKLRLDRWTGKIQFCSQVNGKVVCVDE